MPTPWHSNDPDYAAYYGDGPEPDPWWWTDEEDELKGFDYDR